MANRLPTLAIEGPLPFAVVGTNPFVVFGVVTAPGMPEPVFIDSVVVQVDSQPAVEATLTRIAPSGNQPVQVTFKATVQIIGGQDPHTVRVTVKSDVDIPVTGFVIVTVGPRLVAPAAWIDIQIPPNVVDPATVAARLSSLLGTIAQTMANLQLVKDVFAMNRLVVGPNIVAVANPPTLRIGFWIVEYTFAPPDLIQPTPDFPLPQMTPEAATGCFGLVPLLDQPRFAITTPATQYFFTFALSVPTTTVQLLVDALFPSINKAAERHSFTVNSITVQTDADNDLIGQVSGSWNGISLSGTVMETLGIQQRPGTESNMAAIVGASVSGTLLDILSVIPILGNIIVGAEGGVSEKVSSSLSGVLQDLPAWTPFRSSSLGSGPDLNTLQINYPFPMLVLNFDSFGTNDSGIIGTGTGSLANRIPKMVAVSLSGPKTFPNYKPGTEGDYEVLMTAFEPDNDQMTWQLSGVASTNTVNVDPFLQRGAIDTTFPISSGSETFTLSVNGTETCATDSTKTLNGSASLAVAVTLAKG